MCKRKIIRPDSESIVPLLNGCDCPMVKEFRHINIEDNSTPSSVNIKRRKEYSMPPGCYDIHTQIASGIAGHNIVYRHCECFHPSGICMNLAPLFYYSEPVFNFADLDQEDYDDDDSHDSFDGGMGIRPSLT